MAGSWMHMTRLDGTPHDDSYGNGTMLENGGDVTEALEECYGMIWMMAYWIAGKVTRASLLDVIGSAHDRYADGVRMGRELG